MLAPVRLIILRRTRGLLIAAMAAWVVVQAIGAFCYTKASDDRIFAGNPASMRAAWNPRNVPFLTELRHPRPRGDLLCDAAGSIDRFVPTPLPNPATVPELAPEAVIEVRPLPCGPAPARLLPLIYA